MTNKIEIDKTTDLRKEIRLSNGEDIYKKMRFEMVVDNCEQEEALKELFEKFVEEAVKIEKGE